MWVRKSPDVNEGTGKCLKERKAFKTSRNLIGHCPATFSIIECVTLMFLCTLLGSEASQVSPRLLETLNWHVSTVGPSGMLLTGQALLILNVSQLHGKFQSSGDPCILPKCRKVSSAPRFTMCMLANPSTSSTMFGWPSDCQ